MAYESFYESASSLDPSYGNFTGYRMAGASDMAFTTDPRLASVLADTSMKFNTGIKNIEVTGVSPEVFDSIPEQQLTEIKRLTKLTGTEVSLHAPVVEPSGITREGWSDMDRSAAERQIFNAVERASKMDKAGNLPVVFHSSAGLPEMKERFMQGKEEKQGAVWVVDERTGRYGKLEPEERFFPETEKQKAGEAIPWNPEEEIKRKNKEIWQDRLSNVNFSANRGEDVLDNALRPDVYAGRVIQNVSSIQESVGKIGKGKDFEENLLKSFKMYVSGELKADMLPPDEVDYFKDKFRDLQHAEVYLRDSYKHLKDLYNEVYKNAADSDKKKLNNFASSIQPIVEKIEKDPTVLREFAEKLEEGATVLKSINSPRILMPLNDFAIDKSAETFANVGFQSYKKFGDKSPIINIENPPAGQFGISRAEDLKKLVEEARVKMAKKLVEKEGYSESNAEEAAKKIIGATWDVGHINMLRKYGYGKEELIKEAEKIAPLVKHVHLSDNFGYEHTELPMGMGNVPIKEIMEKLGKEGFEGKKIIEAGSWWQHFKTPPFIESMEAFSSPIYSMKRAPYWNQAIGFNQGYFAGYGTMLPDQHFSMYGAGFSQLPAELGGQVAGRGSRFSGTPNA